MSQAAAQAHPPHPSRGRRRNLYMMDATWKKLEDLGGGNASKGVIVACHLAGLTRNAVANVRTALSLLADKMERLGDLEAARDIRGTDRILLDWQRAREAGY